MADTKTPGEDHEARVEKAFEELNSALGGRLSGPARESLDFLREAARERDAERIRERLSAVQEEHGWLYRELAAHPGVSALIHELAVWGF